MTRKHILVVSRGIPEADNPLEGIFEWDQARVLAVSGIKVTFAVINFKVVRRKPCSRIHDYIREGIHVYEAALPLDLIFRLAPYLICKVMISLSVRIYRLAKTICGFMPLKRQGKDLRPGMVGNRSFRGESRLFGRRWLERKLFAPCNYNTVRLIFDYLLQAIIDKSGKPDIVHAHFQDIAAFSNRAAIGRGIPFVVTEHLSAINTDTPQPLIMYYGEKAYRGASAVISVSDKLRQRLKEHFNIDAVVVPNMVDVESFPFAPVSHEGLVFVSAGNLIPRKNHLAVVRSFINIDIPGSKLYIIGSGPEWKLLDKTISESGFADRIKLKGRLHRKEMGELYRKADVFILTSKWETFGVSYIEAMHAGLPVIATACGGPEDYVTEDNGLLIDACDDRAIAPAMRKMASDYNKYDHRKIHDGCLARFAPDVVARKLDDLYCSIFTHGF